MKTTAVGTWMIAALAMAIARAPVSASEPDAERKAELRRRFQSQELMTGKPYGWILGDQPPRIVWRDPEEIRALGCDGRLRVRWFDAQLNETRSPAGPGRWLTWVEGIAPNGTPLRRGLTFCRWPGNIDLQGAPEVSIHLPPAANPLVAQLWREHQEELSGMANEMLFHGLLDSQSGAILMSAVAEWKTLGRPARAIESAAVLNEDYHVALKLKVQGLRDKVRTLMPPRRRATPATVLHEGTPAEARVKPDAKTKIADVCRQWADDSGEPLVTLVARDGVIVIHQAFGKNSAGKAVGLDYRCDVASITKSVTALLFSRFLDQGLIGLDDPVSKFFPDYPRDDPHVPTFRQCFNHTSGLTGHGDFGGCRNAHFDNIVLNGLDVNEPGVRYQYSGMGFELAAQAMQIVCGRSAVRMYQEHLFGPLGFNDVSVGAASAGASLTAMELGVLAQLVANRGSYGPLELIAPSTFEQLMPRPLAVRERGTWEEEGVGLHWMRHRKPGARPDSKTPEDLLFRPQTLGHGSFSGCIFMIDPEQQLIITQARRQTGPRYDQWSSRFYQAVAQALVSDKPKSP